MWKYVPALDLFYFLILKDIKLRYRQTLFGLAWVIALPLGFMVVFTVVFTRFVRVDTEGVPYALFVLSGLVTWTFFHMSVTRGTMSVAMHANLLGKVHFPRIVLPLASIVATWVDFLASTVVLLAVAVWFGIVPSAQWAALLLVALPAWIFAAGLSLGLSALNVYFRDVQQAATIALQLGMFMSPVFYPLDLVPSSLLPLYCINPLVGAVEGARNILFYHGDFPWRLWWEAIAVASGLFVAGYLGFRAMEPHFADSV
jgi:lipopolysaccharide transport system permease protein